MMDRLNPFESNPSPPKHPKPPPLPHHPDGSNNGKIRGDGINIAGALAQG